MAEIEVAFHPEARAEYLEALGRYLDLSDRCVTRVQMTTARLAEHVCRGESRARAHRNALSIGDMRASRRIAWISASIHDMLVW